MDDQKRGTEAERISHAALKLDPERRRDFIRTECGEDQELLRRVESLMALGTPGQLIGPYQLLSELGSGGMGEVYLARDSRLGRRVALKILLPETGLDPERRRRFLQEAKAASALNHPNIVTVHDVGEWSDGLYLAMEHVEGKTLSAKIKAKRLPLCDALGYAIQVADALAAAHSAGIVHRDVKPANLMITPSGQVKVLDFGIAKLVEPPRGETLSTVTAGPRTRDGGVVGTVAYMSPEQAEGGQVDARSDLFSLGIVLYEMLTGRHPFQRGSALATLSAIAHDAPNPPSQANTSVPPDVERVVMRCLEKDTARRFQDAADLKVALEWLERDCRAAHGGARAIEKRGRRWVGPALAGLCVLLGLAIAAAAVFRFRGAPVQQPGAIQITNDAGITSAPALSRDGKLLAYASDRGGDDNVDIWVQQLPDGVPVRRTTDPADDGSPDFSPDGNTIVFERTGVGVFRTGTFSGSEALLAPEGMNPRFSPDGLLVAYWTGDPGRPTNSGTVFVVRPDGSASRRTAAELAYARLPLWASDGKHLLVQGAKPGDKEDDWWVVPVAGGPPINTGALAGLRGRGILPHSGPGGWNGNLLVFSAISQRMPHIWSVTLKAPNWRFDGAASAVTSGTSSDIEPSVAADGKVAFFSYYFRNNLWRVPLRQDGPAGVMKRISAASAYDTQPSTSADGRAVAFVSRRSKAAQIWLRNMETDTETELTFGAADKTAPAVSPDGSVVAFSVEESGRPSIYAAPAGGPRVGTTRLLCQDCGKPSDWTADAKRIVYSTGEPARVYLLGADSGQALLLLAHPDYSVRQAHFSPDGRWLAFAAERADGHSRIFVSPFHSGEAVRPEEWTPISDGLARDDKPRWLGNDALLYFSDRDGFGCLWKQRLDLLARRAVGQPVEVCALHSPRLSLLSMYRKDFEIAVARNGIIVNLADLTGNIWQTNLPEEK